MWIIDWRVVKQASHKSLSKSLLWSLLIYCICYNKRGIMSFRKGDSLLPTDFAISARHYTCITFSALLVPLLILSTKSWHKAASCLLVRMIAKAPIQYDARFLTFTEDPSVNCWLIACMRTSLLIMPCCLNMINPYRLNKSVQISRHSSLRMFSFDCWIPLRSRG